MRFVIGTGLLLTCFAAANAQSRGGFMSGRLAGVPAPARSGVNCLRPGASPGHGPGRQGGGAVVYAVPFPVFTEASDSGGAQDAEDPLPEAPLIVPYPVYNTDV